MSFSYAGQLVYDLLDPAGLFHDTRSKSVANDQWERSYQLQARALLDQESAFEYQKEYDKWQQQFAQSQDAFSRESYLRNQQFNEDSFAKQLELAKAPVSTVVNDAAKVGVNPMAAMGMSAGSASVSGSSYSSAGVPSSGAGGNFGVSSLSPLNNMPSLISALGSVGSATISASQAERDSKRSAMLRQQELNIIKEKNHNDFLLGERGADIAQQNANANSSNAETNRGNLTARQAEFAFEKIKTRNYFKLEKDMNNFTKSMSEKQFVETRRQFDMKYKQAQSQLHAQLEKIKNDKDFQTGYIRMRYITNFGDKIFDLLKTYFGVKNLSDVSTSSIITNPSISESRNLGEFRYMLGIQQ